MPRPARTRLLAAPLAVALAVLGVLSGVASAADRGAEPIPNRYVVVYENSVQSVNRATDRRERSQGFRSRHRYAHALKGFSASLTRGQVRALLRDPAVDYVAPDLRVEASAQTVPVGITRIGAAGSGSFHGASGVGVAVIDTGVDLDHPDLNVAPGGKNCVGGSSADDDHGHGTHVAGTIAARNNDLDVVGVAPGTPVHAVKVLDNNGSGSTSSVVCGIDWVTQNAASKTIGVANMSLGGGGEPLGACGSTRDPEHQAICDATAGGVAFAVAAGNSGWDFDYEPQPDVPAAYPQVVTVSAMGDTDGKAGGLGSSCSRESDDRYTSWSNYAARSTGDWPGVPHTMAAPGLCILSTKMGGATTSMSGTSMAAPHVAGALALCIDEGGTAGDCAGLPKNDPTQLIPAVIDTLDSYGFAGDPTDFGPDSGRYYGYLLHAPLTGLSDGGTTTDTTAPETTITSWSAEGTEPSDATFSFSSNEAGSTFLCRLSVGGTAGGWENCSTGTKSYTDLAANSYVFEVYATDGAGNSDASWASQAFTVSTSTSSPSSFTLSTTGYKVKGRQRADLFWAGATAASVDVYRNGEKIVTAGNDGAYTDDINRKGGGTYTYKVCDAGTTTCSNESTVTF